MKFDGWDVFLLSTLASMIYLSTMFYKACIENGLPELCI